MPWTSTFTPEEQTPVLERALAHMRNHAEVLSLQSIARDANGISYRVSFHNERDPIADGTIRGLLRIFHFQPDTLESSQDTQARVLQMARSLYGSPVAPTGTVDAFSFLMEHQRNAIVPPPPGLGTDEDDLEFFRNVRELPENHREGLIAEYIRTDAGRQRLAASMIQPLRTRLDYTSIGRRTFMVEQLPSGALPIYDRDPDPTVAPRTLVFHDEPVRTPRSIYDHGVGHDANGSPTSEHAWIKPSWVVADAWAQSEERTVQIVSFAGNRIRVKMWRDSDEDRMFVYDLFEFSRDFKSCDPPKEPRLAWERLLDEDWLDG